MTQIGSLFVNYRRADRKLPKRSNEKQLIGKHLLLQRHSTGQVNKYVFVVTNRGKFLYGTERSTNNTEEESSVAQ